MPDEHTIALGLTAEVLAEEWGITRADQDRFALASHAKAVAAQDRGGFDDELVAVTVPDNTRVAADEGPRRGSTMEALARLRPAFCEGGTVTAGNSSSLNDGAAALLLASEEGVNRYQLQPIVRIATWAVAGVDPRRMGIGLAPATRKALARAGWKLDELAVVELNEAFAAQALAVMADLGLDPGVVNPMGGAIAIGHPLGCSGARIMTTLFHRLASLPGGSRGLATMCVGVGQGIATLVERV